MMEDQDNTATETRMWDIAGKTDFCMFVTMDGKKPWARPMSTIVRAAERRIYLLTDRATMKDDQVRSNPHVVLGYVDNPTFLTVRGVAAVSTDRALIEDLWSPGAQVFWPEGPESADVAVISVTPHEAEYWDGDNRLVSTFKFAWALATGTRISAGDNSKVMLAKTGKRPSSRSMPKSQRNAGTAKKSAKAKKSGLKRKPAAKRKQVSS